MSSKLKIIMDPFDESLKILSSNKFAAAIPLAWPHATARGPEKIWEILRKLGILKTVNFKIGHAAMVVATDSEYLYFDFGRYITPLGYGRTRSAETDPKLALRTVPEWSSEGKLLNVESLYQELEDISAATHGIGPLFASVNYEVELTPMMLYIKDIIERGFVRYNALIKNHSNCARFVTHAMLAGWKNAPQFRKKFRIPPTLAPTPYYNVLAGSSEGNFVIWENGNGEYLKKPSNHALRDMLLKGLESFYSKSAKKLPSDAKMGQLHAPESVPETIPSNSVYIGGIGEGVWHSLEIEGDESVVLTRFYHNGDFEFKGIYHIHEEWIQKIERDFCELVHDTHFCWLTLRCKKSGEKKRFYRKIYS